jgi:hypothetical protein
MTTQARMSAIKGRPQMLSALAYIGAISERFTGSAIEMIAEEIRDLMMTQI